MAGACVIADGKFQPSGISGECRSHALFPHSMLMNQRDEITCSCDLLRVGSNDLEFFFLSFELITNNLDLDFASVMSFDLDFSVVNY